LATPFLVPFEDVRDPLPVRGEIGGAVVGHHRHAVLRQEALADKHDQVVHGLERIGRPALPQVDEERPSARTLESGGAVPRQRNCVTGPVGIGRQPLQAEKADLPGYAVVEHLEIISGQIVHGSAVGIHHRHGDGHQAHVHPHRIRRLGGDEPTHPQQDRSEQRHKTFSSSHDLTLPFSGGVRLNYTDRATPIIVQMRPAHPQGPSRDPSLPGSPTPPTEAAPRDERGERDIR